MYFERMSELTTQDQDMAESALPSDYPETGRVTARFGEAAKAGYQPVPDVLLFHQAELGLRSEDLNVLLQITAHWIDADRMPFPRPSTIAKRMDVSERTIQRSLTRLRKLGLLGKTKNADGRPAFDLTPLVERLRPLAQKRIALRAAGLKFASDQRAAAATALFGQTP